MSASSKKKLRSEERAAKLTERQLAAQKEAKKVTLMTRLFIAVLAVSSLLPHSSAPPVLLITAVSAKRIPLR